MGAQATGDRCLARATNRSLWLVVLALVAATSVVQLLVLLLGWLRFDVGEDQALLWAAAEQWGELSPHQPNFWGQRYGVTFEAIPAEVLRWFGLGYPTAVPLAILTINVAGWGILAVSAWSRARRAWAVAALAVPLVLPMEYLALSVVFNTAVGRLLACCCAGIVIAWPGRRWPTAFAMSAGGLAVLFDSASALIVVPALLVGLVPVVGKCRDDRRLDTLAAPLAVGAVLPLGWYGLTMWWYRVHPDDDLHPAPTLKPQLDVLVDNLGNPTRQFTAYSSELVRSPLVALAVIAVVLAAAFVVGGTRSRLAAAALGALVLFALSLPRSRDGLGTIYYSTDRILMPLPMALWFVAYTTSEAGGHRSARPARAAAVVLALLVACSVVLRVATWSSRVDDLRETAEASPTYPLWRSADLVGLCDRVGRLADAHGVEYALFELRTPAYACAAVLERVTTFYPPYDRRSWTLREVARVRPEAMLLVGDTPRPCGDPATVPCEPVDAGVDLVRLDGLSPLEAAARLGVEIRPLE